MVDTILLLFLAMALTMPFSVLMSVYTKDDPESFHQALLSLSVQTVMAEEVVVVEDGPISSRLLDIIESFRLKLNIISIPLKENNGLAIALNKGLEHCSYELVARMDSDDVALASRFEEQVNFMNSNPDIAVSSGWVEEFDELMSKSLNIRKVPEAQTEIFRFAHSRNPINHPASIFRKPAVIAAGGYPLFRTSQDYALWSLMLHKGHKMANLQKVILNMRTGQGLMERRGLQYLRKELQILRYQREIGFLSWNRYLMNVLIRSAVRLPPSFMKRLLYKLFR